MSAWKSTQLAPWRTAINAGGVAVAPAEGVYGFVADPFKLYALQTLLGTKNRSTAKGYIVLVENQEQLALFCPPLSAECRSAVAEHWQPHQPPTTLVLPALPSLPPFLTGNFPTIAVRMPQVGYVREYLAAAGIPLVSTSLNPSGYPPATSAEEIPSGFPALTLPYPLSGTPSRIFNPQTGTWLR